MAIMAALSMVYSNFGMYKFQWCLIAFSRSAILNPEFAETPPATEISFIPVCFEALISFASKISIMVY